MRGLQHKQAALSAAAIEGGGGQYNTPLEACSNLPSIATVPMPAIAYTAPLEDQVLGIARPRHRRKRLLHQAFSVDMVVVQ